MTCEHIVMITTAYGKPFTVDGFSGWMRDAISDAGLPLDCKPHGLRKAAGRLLAEAGATAKMIMSILGHTTLAEAERYTEEADQAGLAEDAVIRLEGHKANRFSQTAPDSLGKAAEKERKIKMKARRWRSLGESNPCFRRERARIKHYSIVLAAEARSPRHLVEDEIRPWECASCAGAPRSSRRRPSSPIRTG